MGKDIRSYKLVIQPRKKLFDISLSDVWRYRDLISLLIKRDFIASYKQTLLGPFWFILTPLFSVLIYSVIFHGIAGISTEGVPPVLFYLAGLTLWSYFSAVLTGTSNTFIANTAIFGKVYFPRLVVPLSICLSSLLRFAIQFGLLLVVIFFYYFKGYTLHFSILSLLIPILLAETALLAMGIGIIISSLTIKYRDLQSFLPFGIQLWMYITPIIYPVSIIPERFQWIVSLNPAAPMIEAFKFGLIGVGTVDFGGLIYSGIITILILFGGILMFNKVEGRFMDTV